MKKISLLCQKLLLLGVLISVSSTVFGQNTIYSISGVTSKASIVREYQSGIYIVYNTDGSGGHDFLYVDINVPVVYKVSSPINLPMVQINDFEIWEDELYFCGTDGTSGLVGRFNIPSMFNGTYSLDFFSLQPLWNCDAQLTTMVTNLLRLELLPVNNGIHILAIGEGSGGTSRQVVDIGVDYSDPTNYEYIMVDMWGGIFFYDDIVVTSTGVYVVGHKNGSHGEYMVAYNIPPTAQVSMGDNIFMTTSCNSYPIFINTGCNADFYPTSSFLAEHLYNDFFATVCYSSRVSTPGVDEGAVISIYDGAMNLLDRTHITMDQMDRQNWSFVELKYSPWSEKLYLLHNMVVSTWSATAEPVLFSIDMAPYPVGVTAYKTLLVPDTWSIDRTQLTSETIVSGNYSNLRVWAQASFPDNCVLETSLPIDPITMDDSWFDQKDYPTDFYSARWLNFLLNFEVVDITIECENAKEIENK